MKQRCHSIRFWVNASDVGAFMIVAGKTGQGQVLHARWTAVLARNDMVNSKGEGIELLRHLAVFTAGMSSLPYPLSTGLARHRLKGQMMWS
jgi:hypothetical protein